MAKHNTLGEIGEDIAERFLSDKGFLIMDRNYRRKWGELDIVAKKDGIVHFVEVKSVTRETMPGDISRVTNEYKAEDNVHPQKLKRMHRTIETYLLEKRIKETWVIDVVTVEINQGTKTAVCRIIENVT